MKDTFRQRLKRGETLNFRSYKAIQGYYGINKEYRRISVNI